MKESIKNTVLNALGNRIKYINGHEEDIKFKKSWTGQDVTLLTESGSMRLGIVNTGKEKYYLKISEITKGWGNEKTDVGENIKGQWLSIEKDDFIEILNELKN